MNPSPKEQSSIVGPKVVLHEAEKISVWVYPSMGLIHHQVHSPCYEMPFRDALNAGTEGMIRYRANAWLSDDRKNSALSPDDEQWCVHTWFPKAKAVGWKYWAVVKPEKAVGQMNVARFLAIYAQQGITAQIFIDLGPALGWLNQLRTTPKT